MKRRRREYLRSVDDDGLVAADVGEWSEEKYRYVGMYADIFSTGMSRKWDTRVYLDLFSGPGHAILRDSRQRVLSSPLLALDVQRPFDRYVYCDKDPALLQALEQRVRKMAPVADAAFLPGDTNALVDDIAAAIPEHRQDNKVLSFCFVDPWATDIRFDTIRRLGSGRAMDFLILLALGMDAVRNWHLYLAPDDTRIAQFIGEPDWRPRWRAAEAAGHSETQFLAERYAAAMSGLGYLTPGLERMIPVRSRGNNLSLYYLAFFSKHERGYDLWDQVRTYAAEQLTLRL